MTRSCGTELPRAGLPARQVAVSGSVRRGLRRLLHLHRAHEHRRRAVADRREPGGRGRRHDPGRRAGRRDCRDLDPHPASRCSEGVALGLADVTVTTALQEGPLTVASVLTNLYPLVTIALGRRRRRRAASIRGTRLGIVLALAGVSMIAAG